MGKQVLDVLEEAFNALLKFSMQKHLLQVLATLLYIIHYISLFLICTETATRKFVRFFVSGGEGVIAILG